MEVRAMQAASGDLPGAAAPAPENPQKHVRAQG